MDAFIDELRRQTTIFIAIDPTPIEAIPVQKEKTPGGGWITTDGIKRPPENVKVIWPGGITSGIFSNFDGQDVQYDMIVVAEHDSPLNFGDYWYDDNGVKYVIEGFAPNNFYEKKAAVKVYGAGPVGG